MKPTKKHIADKALKLFNEKGFVNIRLQQIADAAFVSVGHLAYHFKTKDAIIDFLYEELKKEQELILSEFRVVAIFEDIHRYFKSVFQLQRQYIFFYLDTLELLRAYPLIHEKHKEHIQWKTQQLSYMIKFNVSRGSLIALSNEMCLELTWLLRAMIDNWQYISRTDIVNDNSGTLFLNQTWSLLKPFFTESGKHEYEQLDKEF